MITIQLEFTLPAGRQGFVHRNFVEDFQPHLAEVSLECISVIGIYSIHVGESGRIIILFVRILHWVFRPPLQLRERLKQMEQVRLRSLPVVIITAAFGRSHTWWE